MPSKKQHVQATVITVLVKYRISTGDILMLIINIKIIYNNKLVMIIIYYYLIILFILINLILILWNIQTFISTIECIVLLNTYTLLTDILMRISPQVSFKKYIYSRKCRFQDFFWSFSDFFFCRWREINWLKIKIAWDVNVILEDWEKKLSSVVQEARVSISVMGSQLGGSPQTPQYDRVLWW